MRARRIFAILGTGLILACCIMIYLMVDVTLLPHNQDLNPMDKTDQLHHLESRLSKLEDDLMRHHQAVNVLQELALKKNEIYNPKDKSAKSSNSFFKPTVCKVNYRQVPEVDIQMLNLYGQLKFDNPDGGVWKQGWNIKYDEKQWSQNTKLKVFVVPHSHNDPGWLNTFEKYYSLQTQGILNNLVTKLSEDKRRKFIWAEISFLKLWWDDQSRATQDLFKQLVHDGQIEIVTGGYVMPDEAVSHWEAQLTQLMEGHQWLKTNLDYVPSTGWAIDPFGLSPTMPYLLKEAGLRNLVIQRVHYSVKKRMSQDKSLEFRWRQLWDNEGSTEIFTHMMPFYSYDVPHTCGPDPKICCQFDFYRLPGYGLNCPWKVPPKEITKANVEERAALLLDQYRKKAQLYKTNVLLIPLGDDFRYSHTTEWNLQFINYQKLFDHMNGNKRMNVQIQFGTLSDYFAALRAQKKVQDFPSLSGDFLTYSDRDDHYWSGYYTSRPFHKRLDRVLLGSLRGAELLNTVAWIKGNDQMAEGNRAGLLDVARRWHSLFQHHDGVTGTARDHVVIDYSQKMITALNNSAHILQTSIAHLLKSPQKASIDLDATYFSLDEQRSHHTSPGEKYVVSIGDDAPVNKVIFYNSLPRTRTKVVSIFISKPFVKVTDKMGQPIECQVSPVWVGPAAMSSARYELSFLVTVPALGLTTYIIHSIHGTDLPTSTYLAQVTIYNTGIPPSSVPGFEKVDTYPTVQELSVSKRPELSVAFGKTGLLKAVRVNEETFPVHLDFIKYGTRTNRDKSGAYLFLPDKQQPDPITVGNDRIVHFIEGPLFSRVFIDIPHVKHICTVYNSTGSDGYGLHISNEVDISDTENFELAMRLDTDIFSGETFYMDLNGLDMIKRQRFPKLPLQGNYYPLSAAGYIEDERVRMTVLTGQPLGAASMASGQFEIMQDRKLNQDDNRGLGQGVMDNLLTYHKFTLLFEKRQKNCRFAIQPEEHPAGMLSIGGHLALEDLLHPVTAVHPKDLPFDLNGSYSPVSYNIPVDLSIASLRVVPIPDGAGKGVGITLHRRALNLCLGSQGLTKRFPVSKTGEINFSEFFGDLQDWTISDTSLTFTTVGQQKKSSVNLCPNQVLSLLFQKTEALS